MYSRQQSHNIWDASPCKRPRVALQYWKRSYLPTRHEQHTGVEALTHFFWQTGPVRQDIGYSCAQTALHAGKIGRVKFDARDGKKRKTAPAKCGLEDGGGGGGGSTDLKQKPEGMSSLIGEFLM